MDGPTDGLQERRPPLGYECPQGLKEWALVRPLTRGGSCLTDNFKDIFFGDHPLRKQTRYLFTRAIHACLIPAASARRLLTVGLVGNVPAEAGARAQRLDRDAIAGLGDVMTLGDAVGKLKQ